MFRGMSTVFLKPLYLVVCASDYSAWILFDLSEAVDTTDRVILLEASETLLSQLLPFKQFIP